MAGSATSMCASIKATSDLNCKSIKACTSADLAAFQACGSGSGTGGTASKCQSGAAKCLTASTIQFCVGGQWTSDTCVDVCSDKGADTSVGCGLDPALGKDACKCGFLKDECEPCTVDSQCFPGLKCLKRACDGAKACGDSLTNCVSIGGKKCPK